MRKRFYLPLWIHHDSDNDVDGCMYFGRGQHQSYLLFQDGADGMPFSKYNTFTEPQMKQMLKHLYTNQKRFVVTQHALMIGEITNRLDKINHNLTDHITGILFWNWKIIPKMTLAHIILSYHIKVNHNIAKFLYQHMIPCKEFDKKFKENLDKDMKASKPISAKEFMKEISADDKEDKKDKLMKPKYFVKCLNNALTKLKEQK